MVIKGGVYAQPVEKPLFTFGLFADVQYCDCDNHGTRFYRSSLPKLTEAIQLFQWKGVDFVVNLGDLIDRDLSSYDTLQTIINQLECPVYHVLGNHDFSVDENYIEMIPSILSMEGRYYTFRKEKWRFIVLDGNDISTYGNIPRSANHKEAKKILQELEKREEPNAYAWNGGIGKKQYKWLEKQLTAAKKTDEKVVVLCHFPLIHDSPAFALWGNTKIMALLDRYDTAFCYFNGHAHEGGYHYANGKHYLTFKGMVEGEDNAFSVIEVYKDWIKVKGHGAEPNRILKFQHHK